MAIGIKQEFTSICLCLANFQDLNFAYFVTRMLLWNEILIQKIAI